MTYFNRFSLIGLFLIAIGQTAVAGSVADGIMVEDPYVRAVPPGQPNSASFMVLHNKGDKGSALMSASTPAADVVELHTHTMEEGMMRMRKVEKIDLPAGEVVKLQPGGLHVMLIGLKQKLVPDEKLSLTLTFADGSSLQVDAPVRKLQMKMKQGDHQGHMH
ncbi:copper chaperone PCu(A)C [Candidatus Thiodiazotropha sp. CDECU1]|uniref:copper chaperone PCu(A)C n=1 Tax=Candidatus Thiodiazotropha sp. CDECU1 TaxID=3065865 RepID=UPI00292E3F0D|nr:copper chaperone PCu(A)C [Candidatus Thiodiazotropha sp. CDECU1]